MGINGLNTIRGGGLGGPGRSHGLGVLEVRHDNGRDGQHIVADNLLGFVSYTAVGEADAGTINGNPGAPF